MSVPKNIAVIGGGPAGLRAAEVAAKAGASVTVYEAQPSVGRKLLVAGKSGLNLTNSADSETFASVYSGGDMPETFWRDCLAEFDNDALRRWAAGLGVETFESSSGKIFPTKMKAALLLRHWTVHLHTLGVKFLMNHRWSGLRHGAPLGVLFQDVGELHEHDAVVLALGGGSWPETGSDGGWAGILQSLGIAVSPLRSANCGWEVAWSPEARARVEGQPLHNLQVRAGDMTVVGELMPVAYGIEGTLIYQLGRTLRAMASPEIRIDFKPTFTTEQLARKMESVRRNFVAEARGRWKLPDAACAMLEQFHGPLDSAEKLAAAAKDCRIPLLAPRPLAEAISTAGGVCWSELDENLMLKKLPGVFCAGEMIDWEAPTGGFLLQGCFATGTRAGRAAAVGL
ncbi:MAG: TIGR03862 family flavoprotein [Chthoniobacteraceae bacterium]